jgi:uncharacterized protein with GYD domain
VPHYITLLRYTAKGIEGIKQSPARTESAKKSFQLLGGKMHAFYLTMGQYDAVVVSEFPDDESAAKATLAAGALGSVRTETMRAFTEEEYRKIVASLP